MDKIAIYTSLIGNYDNLRTPEIKDTDKFDYICFSDNKNLKSDFWKIIYLDKKDFKNLDNTRISRYIKTHPHVLLPNYESWLYIDANMHIIGDLNDMLNTYRNKKDFLFSKHLWRSCTYDEAEICKKVNLDNSEIIDKWLNILIKENFPKNYGLIESNVIYRVNNNFVNNFDEQWWDIIKNYSKRDQLSIMYLLWKNNVKYDLMPNARISRYFKHFEHLIRRG